ncbi:hypothetical protein [Lysinibacter cavernae]|uniref:Septum formation-related domain-containing protein n=1 Tax=Lysinibacter cavernae TaxID=1640652 RepID=A0A7X5R4F7_9MICO|nr:hypothetical protein [Lysinibacter cavernae]NIH55145.1 hypothetical protein [Lysinibacter cavernae]
MNIRNIFVPAAIVTLAIGSLTGCSVLNGLLGNGTEVRDDSGAVVESGDANVFAISVGDCFTDEGTADEVDSLPVVPCGDPHDNEVYFNHVMQGGTFPGDAAIADEAATVCGQQFPTFVGLPYEESVLDYSAVMPTADSWTFQSDYIVSCYIYDTVPVTGTLAGAAR